MCIKIERYANYRCQCKTKGKEQFSFSFHIAPSLRDTATIYGISWKLCKGHHIVTTQKVPWKIRSVREIFWEGRTFISLPPVLTALRTDVRERMDQRAPFNELTNKDLVEKTLPFLPYIPRGGGSLRGRREKKKSIRLTGVFLHCLVF